MATLAQALTTDLTPMEGVHQRMGVENPLLKFLLHPSTLLGMAGGVGGAALAKRGRGLRKAAMMVPRADDEMPVKMFNSGVLKGRIKEEFPETFTFASRKFSDRTSPLAALFLRTTGRNPDTTYMHSLRTPAFDWDLGDAERYMRTNPSWIAHGGMEDTVGNLGEVIETLAERERKLGELSVPTNVDLYMTPGGYRGIELAHSATPSVGHSQRFLPEKVDPGYVQLSPEFRGFSLPGGGTFPYVLDPGYSLRMSRKPMRYANEDYIAARVGNVGSGAPVQPNVDTRNFHDMLIQQNISQGKGLSEKILNDVAKEMKYLTPQQRDMVRKFLVQWRPSLGKMGMPVGLAAAGAGAGSLMGDGYG